MSMQKTWIILGASSPIARAFAHIAASEKCDLILVGRDERDLQDNAGDLHTRYHVKVHTIVSDLANCDRHAGLIKQCQELAPQGFNVYLAFAVMPPDHEFKNNPELSRDVLNVNAVAPVHFLECLAPVLVEQKDSHLIVLGSVAGDRGRHGNAVYSASKACLNLYVETLRLRLSKSGITVTLVKPGFIDTRMVFYSDKVPFSATPEACAFACWQSSKYKKGTIYVPWYWRMIMYVAKRIPEVVMKQFTF